MSSNDLRLSSFYFGHNNCTAKTKQQKGYVKNHNKSYKLQKLFLKIKKGK